MSWITSLRGLGATVGLPWMSYSRNRDCAPVLTICVLARSAADKPTVWSLLPPSSGLRAPLTVSMASHGVPLSPPMARAAINSAMRSCVDRYERLPRREVSCVSRFSRRSCFRPYWLASAYDKA
ncbi:hypothetical protein D3C72_911740 [compost metagenome]